MKKIYPLIIEVIILLLTLLTVSIMIAFSKIGLISLIIVVPVIYIFNAIFIIYIFLKERNFETKISWIIFVILIPIIGNITFLFLGRGNKGSISKIEYEKEYSNFSNGEIIDIGNKEEINYFEEKISLITKRKWKKSTFEFEKHSFASYEKLFNDLEKAKHYIHIEMYIMKPSEIYDQFKSILIKKIKEKVEIKLIIDDFGKWNFDENELSELKDLGINIIIFNKINFPFINLKQSFRLHRKMIIIDGNIVHAGGINISDEYSSFDKKYGYWADINSRITGDICNDYSQLFLYDWFKLTNEKLSPSIYLQKQLNKNTNSYSLLLEEGPNINEYILEQSLMNAITLSKKKIRIATPYFVPSKKIMNQFKFALLEGVEVEIFIPGLADKKYVLETTHIYLNELILAGAKVYELKNIFLHSKIGTFDNENGYLGTINWDMRTFFSNYESLNYLSGEIIFEIDSLFDEYKEFSTLIQPTTKRSKSLFFWIKFFILKTLAPLF